MKRLSVIILLLAVLLTGCHPVDIRVQTQLVPPGLSGDRAEIQTAFESYLYVQRESLVDTYRLEYPASGDYRSAFILKDIDGDRAQEALVFYRRYADSNEIHMNILCDGKNGWHSVADFVCSSTSVQEVRFADLFGDGGVQILVGWSVGSTRESRLQIFRWQQDAVSLCYSGLYSFLVPIPLSSENKDDLLLIHLQADSTATATLLSTVGNGMVAVANTPLDGTVLRYTSAQVNMRQAGGRVGVFLDAEKVNGTLTELLVWDGESLTAPLYDPLAGGTVASWRASSLSAADINGNGTTDWPTTIENADPLLYRWQTWNFEKQEIASLCLGLVPPDDGYTWVIPSGWGASIRTRYDAKTHSLTVFRGGEEAFSVTRVNKGSDLNDNVFTDFETYDYLIRVTDASPLSQHAIIARLIEL